jgi:NAD(P)-dependent dehydrogenase (short-subunit alcohol dehydrogenase family)
MIKSVLITGANSGLGKDAARQLALQGAEKIYISGRNLGKLQVAKSELEQVTGKNVFDIIVIDTSKLESVSAAVKSLPEPVEGLIMNAGGVAGGDTKHASGAVDMFAINVLGHVVLFEELVKEGKLTKVAMYAGSEAANGVPRMGIPVPVLKTFTVDEISSVIDGTYFDGNTNNTEYYGYVKYLAAMWVATMARKHPNLRVVTMSPGGTAGTNVASNMPGIMGFFMRNIGMQMMTFFGLMHSLETGAKRYVEVLNNEKFKSGVFYASHQGKMSGEVVDQSQYNASLGNATYQEHVTEAIHNFVPA